MSHNFLGAQFIEAVADGEPIHVPAGHLMKALYGSVDVSAYDSQQHMWDSKLHEAIATGLAHDVADNGVQEPVDVWVKGHDPENARLMMGNGHHRLVSAVASDPDRKIPVRADQWPPY